MPKAQEKWGREGESYNTESHTCVYANTAILNIYEGRFGHTFEGGGGDDDDGGDSQETSETLFCSKKSTSFFALLGNLMTVGIFWHPDGA